MTIREAAPGRTLFAGALALGALGIAWLCIRFALLNVLTIDDPRATALAGRSPDVVLARAMNEFVVRRGRMRDATMTAVGNAAQQRPLDARPYLLFGLQGLVRHDDAAAQATLEAGRRLDGRDRWIRLLLLDRYLKTGRAAAATNEFAVLARLVSAAQTPILAEMARMTNVPANRTALRQALARDPDLERSLLTTLAQTNPDPSLIFSLASPAALAEARAPGSWGETLIGTLVQQRHYDAARALWSRLYRLPPTAGESLYDPDFRRLPGAPPFNWSFTASNIGAADPHDGQLGVDYYGRDSGQLMAQTMALLPGRYRLAFNLSGPAQAASVTLSWRVTCADQPDRAPLIDAPLPGAASATRRYTITFAVPATGCRAQQLALNGNAAEFPSPINATLSALRLQRVGNAE